MTTDTPEQIIERAIKRYAELTPDRNPNQTEFADLRRALLAGVGRLTNVKDFTEMDTLVFWVDAIAGTGAYAHMAIDAAWGEGNLSTARRDESIRAIVSQLGVRQKRKTPAVMDVTITRTIPPNTPNATELLNTALTINAYSQFSVSGRNFFNKEDLVFEAGHSTISSKKLYEGTVKVLQSSLSQSAIEVERPFPLMIVQGPGFEISDNDVQVTVSSSQDGIVELTVVKNNIWNYRKPEAGAGDAANEAVRVVQDFTMSNGDLLLKFGNNQFAYDVIEKLVSVKYVETSGADGRQINVKGQEISLDYVPGITNVAKDSRVVVQESGRGNAVNTIIGGEVTGALVGGSDETPAEVYRQAGPRFFAAQDGKAVDRSGYQVTPLLFKNVVDCDVIPSSSYAPDAVRFQNILRVSLLTDFTNNNYNDDANDDDDGNSYWDQFVEFLENNGLYTARYKEYKPSPVSFAVAADVKTAAEVSSSAVEQAILVQLNQLFRIRYGSLGLNINEYDLMQTIGRTNTTIIKEIKLIKPPNVTKFYRSLILSLPEEFKPTFTAKTGGAAWTGNEGVHEFEVSILTDRRTDRSTTNYGANDIGESLPVPINNAAGGSNARRLIVDANNHMDVTSLEFMIPVVRSQVLLGYKIYHTKTNADGTVEKRIMILRNTQTVVSRQQGHKIFTDYLAEDPATETVLELAPGNTSSKFILVTSTELGNISALNFNSPNPSAADAITQPDNDTFGVFYPVLDADNTSINVSPVNRVTPI